MAPLAGNLAGAAEAFHGADGVRGGSVERAAEYLDVPAALVAAAVAYREDHRAEVDGWIERNRELAEREYARGMSGDPTPT